MDFKFIQQLFIQQLTNTGTRVFNIQQATKAAGEIGMSSASVRSLLHRLSKRKMVERLRPGLYCLAPEFLRGPIHEYEIALALASPFLAIAYLSAISYHKLTDQVSSIFYVVTLEDMRKSRSSNYTYTIKGLKYRIVYIKKQLLWY